MERSEYIPVIDDNGTLYYNKIVDEDELFLVDYDIDVVDTYTIEYGGRTYTNKIVEK